MGEEAKLCGQAILKRVNNYAVHRHSAGGRPSLNLARCTLDREQKPFGEHRITQAV